MTEKEKYRRRISHLCVTAPVAVTFLLVAAPAESDWKPSFGVTAASAVAVLSVSHILKKTLGDSIELAKQTGNAVTKGDDEEVRRLSGELDNLPGKIIWDASLPRKAISRIANKSRSTAETLKKRLRSAERKIVRLVGKVGRIAADGRIALAPDEDERQWYESDTGILANEPLPVVNLPNRPQTLGQGDTDLSKDENAFLDWRPRGSNPVGEYALRCEGVSEVSRYTALYPHFKSLMERYSGACPPDDPYHSEWTTVLDEGNEADPWAPEQEELVVDSSPVGHESASHYQQDKSDDDETVPDYRAALDVLERQEAEAERRKQEQAAQEARRRTETLAKAQREEQKRLEYQRKAAERERRELQAQRERESERLASQRRSQSFQNSINQSIQMLNQSVQMLKDAREERRPRKSGCGTGYSQGRSRSCGEE